eukprot:380642-Alexandrium_andersonii.AAC.1
MGSAAPLLRRRPALGSARQFACCSEAVPPLHEPVPAAEPAKESASTSSIAQAVCFTDSVLRRRPAM